MEFEWWNFISEEWFVASNRARSVAAGTTEDMEDEEEGDESE